MEAIKAIRKTKNFEPLAVSFKRIRKILEKAGPEAGWKLPAVRPDLFAADAERNCMRGGGRSEGGGAIQARRADTARRCKISPGCVPMWTVSLMK